MRPLRRVCADNKSKSTVHIQNQLEAGSFVGTKAGVSHEVPFFARAMK